jgi:hypothetical protein
MPSYPPVAYGVNKKKSKLEVNLHKKHRSAIPHLFGA